MFSLIDFGVDRKTVRAADRASRSRLSPDLEFLGSLQAAKAEGN